jgi:hypothetical protein
VVAAKDIRMSQNEQERLNSSMKQPVLARSTLDPSKRLAPAAPSALAPKQATTVFQVIPPAATYSILGRHRQRKAQEESVESKPGVNAGVSLGIPDFLKRFARSTSKV